MYLARIVFDITNNHDLKIDDEKIILNDGNRKCKFTIDRRYGSITAIIVYGVFHTYDEAIMNGNKLFYSLQKQFATHGVPIEVDGLRIGKHTGQLTEDGKEYFKSIFPQYKDKIIVDEYFGIGIFEVESDIDEINNYAFVTQELEIKRTSDFFVEFNQSCFDDKLKLAYTMLNTSNTVNDQMSSFVLKTSAIEVLVADNQKKASTYCAIIDKLNKRYVTKDLIDDVLKNIETNSSIDEKAKLLQNVKSDIGELKRKSIGEKCLNLIEEANIQGTFGDKPPKDFFALCYKIRSNFVHSGRTEKIFVDNNIHALSKLALQLLEYYESKCTISI